MSAGPFERRDAPTIRMESRCLKCGRVVYMKIRTESASGPGPVVPARCIGCGDPVVECLCPTVMEIA